MKKIFELEQEIKRILEKATSNIILKGYSSIEKMSKVVERSPKVIVGQIPKENLEEIVPCITIKSPKGKNALTERRIELRIALAIFNDSSEEGYSQLYDLLENIGKVIIEKGTLLNEFEILPEYNWNLLEEQPYPYWAGEIIFNILGNKQYRTDIDDWINGREY